MTIKWKKNFPGRQYAIKICKTKVCKDQKCIQVRLFIHKNKHGPIYKENMRHKHEASTTEYSLLEGLEKEEQMKILLL